MKTIIINESIFFEEDDLHAYLAARLDFPAYYGNNLDALQDCLGDIDDQTRVYIVRLANFESEGAEWFGRFIRVFKQAASDNPNLDIIVCRMLED